MNSLRSAWTPVLAGSQDPHRQAKGDTEARPFGLRTELYSLSDWYKISVRPGESGCGVVRIGGPVVVREVASLALGGGSSVLPVDVAL